MRSGKGTGTCQACAAHKKKCSNMVESVRKAKQSVSTTNGSSCKTSEGSQGRERSDMLQALTSAMQRLTVLEVVEVPSTQEQ